MWHGGGMGMGHGHGGLDDDDSGQIYNHEVIKRLFPYFKSRLGLFTLSMVMMLVYTSTLVLIPWLIGYTIDNYVLSGDLSGLNRVGLVLIGVITANLVGNYLYMRLLGKISQEVLYKLRTDMFNHLQKLSVPFFDRNEVGRIMSRVMSDVGQLQEFLPMVTITLGDMLSLVGIIIVMFLMNWQLALVTIVVLPLLALIMGVWQRYARVAFIRIRYAISVVNTRLQQNISGVRVVQSMNREDLNLHQFDRVNMDHLDANLRAIRLSAILMPTVDVITAIALGLVIVIGGTMVLNESLGAGALVAFALYVQRFYDPIRNLTMQYTQFQRAMTGGVRIFELMDVEPEVVDKPDAKPLPFVKGEIRYEGVWLEYVPGIPVLKDVNLHIKPGTTAALVGQTGAGKTSMVSLLMRFYDVTSGRLAVDGYDLRDIQRSSLASQASTVLQEPFLFSVSVVDNIKYRHTEATMEQVIRAATAVGAHDFIMKLENGYDTILYERGGNLSVGQRQLISFARAILADPRILILDEATANIDTFTEVVIQQALKEMLKDRTAVVIAHRLSTIQNADMIVVMEQGRIVDTGTHDELLERSPIYSRLYALNFQDLEETEAPLASVEETSVAESRQRQR